MYRNDGCGRETLNINATQFKTTTRVIYELYQLVWLSLLLLYWHIITVIMMMMMMIVYCVGGGWRGAKPRLAACARPPVPQLTSTPNWTDMIFGTQIMSRRRQTRRDDKDIVCSPKHNSFAIIIIIIIVIVFVRRHRQFVRFTLFKHGYIQRESVFACLSI